jgi:hypothetical protein
MGEREMTKRPEQKKWSETRNQELTLEELFKLIGDVEWNLKDYIWELKQEVEELKKIAHFHDDMYTERDELIRK